MSGDGILRVENVGVRYGGVVANADVSITLTPGTVTGLIGPNGAGKTTLVDAISGFTSYSGSVLLGDRRLDRLAPHRRRRAGVARTWQSGELFTNLTVAENVRVPLAPGGWGAFVRDFGRQSSRTDEAVEAVLERVGLAGAGDRIAGELPLGQQKLVGIARALAGDAPVVLLDEPAAGLDSAESQALGIRVRAIADSGVAVLLIDHDLSLVLAVCDSVTVLHFGRVIFDGVPADAVEDAGVVAAYLGSTIERDEAEHEHE
jgi:branched-chain amino acid transport system ATP-binding protein